MKYLLVDEHGNHYILEFQRKSDQPTDLDHYIIPPTAEEPNLLSALEFLVMWKKRKDPSLRWTLRALNKEDMRRELSG